MLFSSIVTHASVELPLTKDLQDALRAEGLTLPDSLKEAHPGRQEKFLAGRYCALLALKKSGALSIPKINILTDGSPGWPAGWVGSITHHEKMAGAAVAKSDALKGLGMDYELIMSQKTFENVSARILVGKEKNSLRPEAWDEKEWATPVFSAKESIYKCLRPHCGHYFGFEAAELTTFDEKGSFTFQLTQDIGAHFKAGWNGEGRFEKNGNQIFTSMEYR